MKNAESIAMIVIAITATGGLMIQVFQLGPAIDEAVQRVSELETSEKQTFQQLKELSESTASLADQTSDLVEKQEGLISSFRGITELIQGGIAIIDGDRVVILNDSVSYSAKRSVIPDGEIIRYEWLIDDKVEYTGQIITHIFTETGEHFIELTIFDEDGKRGLSKINVKVQEPFE